MYRSIQACRAIAALLVVCFHTGGNLNKEKYFGAAAAEIERLFSFGDCGVAFFFVLSGFIITFVHRRDFGQPTRLAYYASKRIIRIYPAYIAVFMSVYAFAMLTPSLSGTMLDGATLFRSLLLLPQDPAVVGGTGAPVLVVAWSLLYEVMFYALFGLAIWGRWPFGMGISILALNALAFFALGTVSFPQSFFVSKWILLFAFGMGVEFVAHSGHTIRLPEIIAGFGATGFMSLAAIEIIYGRAQTGEDRALFYGVASALLLLGLIGLEDKAPTQPREGWLTMVGDSSYLLYLIHFPLVSILCKIALALGLHGRSGAILSLVFIVPTCVFSAFTLHAKIERPLLVFLNAYSRGLSQKAA